MQASHMIYFSHIKAHVLHKLQYGLPSYLTYHNIAHTLDVLKQCEAIARESGITDSEDLLLLKVSALYHDTGFLYCYKGHEEKSCELATQELPQFGFSSKQIERICNMIRATRLPQSPTNTLEKIICDADLDYLGRKDFFSIGEGLFQEFIYQKVVANELEWNQLQVRFLENHEYFIAATKRKREAIKQKHLSVVKKKAAL